MVGGCYGDYRWAGYWWSGQTGAGGSTAANAAGGGEMLLDGVVLLLLEVPPLLLVAPAVIELTLSVVRVRRRRRKRRRRKRRGGRSEYVLNVVLCLLHDSTASHHCRRSQSTALAQTNFNMLHSPKLAWKRRSDLHTQRWPANAIGSCPSVSISSIDTAQCPTRPGFDK